MDITLLDTNSGTVINPTSIHGILWLQLHFESNHWHSLSEGKVKIPMQDSHMLCEDAKKAGLNVNFINSLSQLDKI